MRRQRRRRWSGGADPPCVIKVFCSSLDMSGQQEQTGGKEGRGDGHRGANGKSQ